MSLFWKRRRPERPHHDEALERLSENLKQSRRLIEEAESLVRELSVRQDVHHMLTRGDEKESPP